MAFAPSCINDELNVSEAWQVMSERASSIVSRYVRFVAPGIGRLLRGHTCAVEAAIHGEAFATAHVSLEPTVGFPVTDVVTSLPFPVPAFEIHDVPCSVNHIAPSVPTAIPAGTAALFGVANSVNHIAPSGSVVIPHSTEPAKFAGL